MALGVRVIDQDAVLLRTAHQQVVQGPFIEFYPQTTACLGSLTWGHSAWHVCASGSSWQKQDLVGARGKGTWLCSGFVLTRPETVSQLFMMSEALRKGGNF